MNRAMLAAVGALAACVAAKTGVQAAQEVTTIAGSGAAGIADGPAQKATFLFPYGVAVAHDGSIYISDRAAQRIRVLTPAGQVRTVAGSGSIAPPGLIVPPGYHDGPALQAQFAGPEGLAIGPDGALYIADAYNHCVRKLANDEVSTVVGKCDRTGVTDGPAGVAMLNNPESLAFDASGNLYIADDGIGLRKLGTDGVLSTIRFKSYTGQSARSVAVVNSPEELVVVGGFDGVVVYHPATGTDAHFSAYTLEWPRAVPNQLAAIDARQFVFADPQAENIRYVRLPAPPFDGAVFTRAIAGGEAEHTSDNAGFANGSRAQARFYDPMGIAIAGRSWRTAETAASAKSCCRICASPARPAQPRTRTITRSHWSATPRCLPTRSAAIRFARTSKRSSTGRGASPNRCAVARSRSTPANRPPWMSTSRAPRPASPSIS